MKHQLFDLFVREKIVVILRGLVPEKAQACGDALQNLRGCNTVKISTCIIVGTKPHSTHITTSYF